eukprot:GFUD01015223.1.p1 GENE.GFUD01015223.1~~GFUD01015223.1.p1  ORF type:complete len:513 (+),score=144.46 GFUD01015223.1:59-1597(+)
MKFSLLAVPGAAPGDEILGAENGKERTFKISEYKGRYLVIVFYHGDWECQEYLQAFSDLQDKFRSVKAEVVGCSIDSSKGHLVWMKTDKSDGGFGGKLQIALWTDTSGSLSDQFDLYDKEENQCLDGVVIIDDAGVVRHAMTTSLECADTAKNTFELVNMLKKYKVDAKDVKKSSSKTSSSLSSSSSSGREVSPVKISREELEKDWDVSEDPELIKVLNMAKMLGRAQPPKVQTYAKNPLFNLLPLAIRRLSNPRAPVKCCTASLFRNLAGFGPNGDISKNQKLQLENLMKKVMGVAYMPEDLTGKFTSLSSLNQREQTKFFDTTLMDLTGDSYMKEPNSVKDTEGKGVFVNNYSNFVLWVNCEDQLRLVSVAKGQDLKYVLLRLQKAVARIEEALKMVFSTKSCQQRGFTTANGGFSHSRREVYGTGFETTFTMELLGFGRAGRDEMEKASRELNIKMEKNRNGVNTFTVVLRQGPDDTEQEIVTKSVEAVDTLGKMDKELQSRLGVKLTL